MILHIMGAMKHHLQWNHGGDDTLLVNPLSALPTPLPLPKFLFLNLVGDPLGLVNVSHASLGWGLLLKPQLMLY